MRIPLAWTPNSKKLSKRGWGRLGTSRIRSGHKYSETSIEDWQTMARDSHAKLQASGTLDSTRHSNQQLTVILWEARTCSTCCLENLEKLWKTLLILTSSDLPVEHYSHYENALMMRSPASTTFSIAPWTRPWVFLCSLAAQEPFLRWSILKDHVLRYNF